MIQLINFPLKDKFYDLVAEADERIRLCAPFVKQDIVSSIYENKKPDVQIDIISNFNLANFYNGSSDIEAFKIIIKNGGKVFNYQSLHAKVYIFDNKYSLITSSNLTTAGFERNYEYGALFTDWSLISKTIEDYEMICSNDSTGVIDYKKIISLEKLLESISDNHKYKKLIYVNTNEVDNLLNIDTNLLLQNMNPWQRLTFHVISLINNQVFSLAEVYEYEQIFQTNYPNNNTIRDSIRRNLQELRDLGLIKFLGNGIYKKLWV